MNDVTVTDCFNHAFIVYIDKYQTSQVLKLPCGKYMCEVGFCIFLMNFEFASLRGTFFNHDFVMSIKRHHSRFFALF